jgi:hypothetical protein
MAFTAHETAYRKMGVEPERDGFAFHNPAPKAVEVYDSSWRVNEQHQDS